MFSRIIVGVDGTERGQDALALARLLTRETGASLILASVVPAAPLLPALGGAREFGLDEAERRITEADELLAGVGTVERRPLADSSPARGLHRLAESEGADLIVVGSSHRGRAGRVLPGSVGERLLHGAPCAVAVAPKDFWSNPDPRLRVIGAGYDASAQGIAALKTAEQLALLEDAALRVITVIDGAGFGNVAIAGGYGYADIIGQLREDARNALTEVLEAEPKETRADGVLVEGDAAAELVKQSETLDLLVTGSRGYGMIGRVVLGGVSARVIREAHCPVLVVPSSGDAAGG